MVGLGKIFGRSVKNFGRPGQFLKVWKKIRNVREKISEKMYGKKSRGSKIFGNEGEGRFRETLSCPPQNACCPSNTPPPKFRDLAPPLPLGYPIKPRPIIICSIQVELPLVKRPDTCTFHQLQRRSAARKLDS